LASDPDYHAATIANYVLGGGGFASRLMEEVREKRGLAYSVYTYLADMALCPLWLGGVATSNERVAQSIELVRAEVAKLARQAPEEREVADAKTYLTGSFPLRLATNDQLARMLLGMMVHGLGRDYLERRNDLVRAVTREDLERVCRRLYAGELLVTVAGRPEGLPG
jgi:zinc protease